MIPLMKNAFLNEFATKKALANFILETDKFSMGEECNKFEQKFATFQQRKHAILFNSGGSANLALLQALKNLNILSVGDNVAFSALTWSTNIMPILQMGLNPIPIDCEINTLNVSSRELIKTIENNTIKCLFITNVLGFVDDIDKIREICFSKKIILLEDNCESLGTVINSGIMTGNFGLASTFSFFVAHHMSTIEGGMICTDNDDLAEMLTIVRANGWDRNLNATQQFKWRSKYNIDSELQAKYTFYDLAFNLRPTEITGFLGSFQLNYLEENIKARENNFKAIDKYVNDNDDLIKLDYNHLKTVSTFAIPILCKTEKLRDRYINQFAGAGIEIRPMIAGNMLNQPFYSKYVKEKPLLPNTEFIDKHGFYCGNYPELTKEDIETIISALLK